MTNDRTDCMGSYERLFQALPQPIPSPHLCERVLDGIRRERTRHARTRFVFSSVASVAALGVSVYAAALLAAAAAQSGFTAYAGLAFSDGSALAAHASAFGTLLLESLPGPEVTFLLLAFAILIQSVRIALSSAIDWRLSRTPRLA